MSLLHCCRLTLTLVVVAARLVATTPHREGRATITLQPGQSLTRLKTAIKKAFGKVGLQCRVPAAWELLR